MPLMTIKNRPMTERLLERREQYFNGIDQMTDEQIERVSVRWHAVANRYQKMIARILVNRMEAN